MIDHCENAACSWILEPFNAWTCAAYVLVGLYLFARARREAPNLRPIGISAVLVGLLSFPLHATVTLWAEFLDLFSMYTLSTYAFTAALYRLRGPSVRTTLGIYFGILGSTLLILLAWKEAGVWLFIAAIAATLGLEFRLYRLRRRADAVDYRSYGALLAFFAVSLIIWALEFTGVWCDPTNHFLQGHGLWHIVNSFCFYWLYRFYRQFDFGGGERAPWFRLAAPPDRLET